jgi:hypothetical protein
VAKLVARLLATMLATAALWVRIQTSLKNTKYKMGDMSKGVANTMARPKNIKIKNL